MRLVINGAPDPASRPPVRPSSPLSLAISQRRVSRDLPLTLAHFSRSQSVPSGSNSPYQQHAESEIFPYRHDLP